LRLDPPAPGVAPLPPSGPRPSVAIMAPYAKGVRRATPSIDEHTSFAEWAQLSDAEVEALVECSKVGAPHPMLPLKPNAMEKDKYYVEPGRMYEEPWSRAFIRREEALHVAVSAFDEEVLGAGGTGDRAHPGSRSCCT
jgi:hypothetical protein